MARTVDADELQELCNRRIQDTWNSGTAPVSWAAAYADFKDDIDSIPTFTPPNGSRMINADKLAKRIAGHNNYHGDSILAAIYCAAKGKESDAPIHTIENSPNELLTEEQLREMVGHPVWIKSARRKEWMLLWGYHGPEVYGRAFIFTRRTAQKEQFPFSELGVTWWPYRCPPDGEEE